MTLEEFRKNSIKELKQNSKLLKLQIKKIIKQKFDLYIIGSVLYKNIFTENSDVDIGIFIYDNKIENGPNEQLTDEIRDKLLKIPFNFGNVDVIVFNNTKSFGIKI